MNTEQITNLFDRPKLIGLVADANQGKSNLLYFMVNVLQSKYKFNLHSYGLRVDLGERKIYSVEQLETIHDSIIIIDEFASLFDIDDRKEKKQIEKTLRLIFHNNNVVILGGLPENYKKFIASKLDVIIYKRCALKDFINGSRVKQVAYNYSGDEMGAAVFTIGVDRAIIYNGTDYIKVDVPYMEKTDTKANNVSILQDKKRS